MKHVCATLLVIAGAIFASAPAFAVVPAPGVSHNEVTVGSVLDLSGPLSAEGIAIKNGLSMAFGEINAKGGVLGRRITLIAEDSAYDPIKARMAAQSLLKRGVFAVIGSDGTPPVSATMPMILNSGILHLFPFASADETYVPSQPLEFAMDLTVSAQIREGLNALLDERGNLKVGVLARGDDFGRAARDGAQQALARRKLQLTASAEYPPGTTKFTFEINKLRRAGVELVVLAAVAQDAFEALKQAHARGWYPVFFCPETCYVPEVATLGGRASSGLYTIATTPIPYPDTENAALRDWVRRYEARYATVASQQAFRAYLDGRLFAEALARTGAHPTQRHFARVLEAMPAWRDPVYGGVPVNYTAQDHLGLHGGFLAQIRNGRWAGRQN